MHDDLETDRFRCLLLVVYFLVLVQKVIKWNTNNKIRISVMTQLLFHPTSTTLLIPVLSENDSRVYFLIVLTTDLALLDVSYSGALYKYRDWLIDYIDFADCRDCMMASTTNYVHRLDASDPTRLLSFMLRFGRFVPIMPDWQHCQRTATQSSVGSVWSDCVVAVVSCRFKLKEEQAINQRYRWRTAVV